MSCNNCKDCKTKPRIYKTVFMPIEVPDNDFCWDGIIGCYYFDNEGGGHRCELGFFLERDKHFAVPKPDRCKILKERI